VVHITWWCNISHFSLFGICFSKPFSTTCLVRCRHRSPIYTKTGQGHSYLRSGGVKRKRLIKEKIPSEFLLEWFIKYLLSIISKDVSTSWVFSEEEAIFRAQQLDLIYSQSRILYKIILDAPWPSFNPAKMKSGPHFDGIVGSIKILAIDLVTNQMQQMSIHPSVIFQANYLTIPTIHWSNVHAVQSTTPKVT